MSDPELRAAEAELIRTRVDLAIDAKVIEYQAAPRSTWNGDGFDVKADFVVLWWRRPQSERDPGWGTHRGCIRYRLGEDPYAHIFIGHYCMSEEKAREDFVSRRGGLG